ncbi:MAG: DUF5130 domain-containing protein [Williamsia herbipolensis]|uniref:TLP18.3, Psb32 and MOLO-1 founding proteins of phosphatase n=1 Tax=Williamsia serinedens TaxID=391736 RepID=A0ABT1GV97_9NOCA|nr:DUF5130 domain-containing protein [Williamsia serinedens]MBE7161501.1 DUF5130 domain-containing protein [Williamsia herbipolensis]MCP2158901.1 TLP18.3, Psb32 and MOLO-1 founding proteins of phosphatase [Williamsia serinedens]
MASGEIKPVVTDPDALPLGHVVTTSGRISAARTPGSAPETPPFDRDELVALDEALSNATELAMVRFSVYIGDLGGDPVAKAGEILPQVPEPEHAALIAVSPNSKDVVVVSGRQVADRINDRVAQLGVTAAIAGFRENDLIDGVIAALRVMATAVARS